MEVGSIGPPAITVPHQYGSYMMCALAFALVEPPPAVRLARAEFAPGAVLPKSCHCCVGAAFQRMIPPKVFSPRLSLASVIAWDSVGPVVAAIAEMMTVPMAVAPGYSAPSDALAVVKAVLVAELVDARQNAKAPICEADAVPEMRISSMSTSCDARLERRDMYCEDVAATFRACWLKVRPKDSNTLLAISLLLFWNEQGATHRPFHLEFTRLNQLPNLVHGPVDVAGFMTHSITQITNVHVALVAVRARALAHRVEHDVRATVRAAKGWGVHPLALANHLRWHA